VRNAVNLAVSQGISAALGDYEQRPDVRAAVLAGAGGTFCAGMDLKAFAERRTPGRTGR
jgi:enoyl-CoA hydratase